MEVDPRIENALRVAWRGYGKACELIVFEMCCFYVLGCVLAGSALTLHQFEKFLDFVFTFTGFVKK